MNYSTGRHNLYYIHYTQEQKISQPNYFFVYYCLRYERKNKRQTRDTCVDSSVQASLRVWLIKQLFLFSFPPPVGPVPSVPLDLWMGLILGFLQHQFRTEISQLYSNSYLLFIHVLSCFKNCLATFSLFSFHSCRIYILKKNLFTVITMVFRRESSLLYELNLLNILEIVLVCTFLYY